MYPHPLQVMEYLAALYATDAAESTSVNHFHAISQTQRKTLHTQQLRELYVLMQVMEYLAALGATDAADPNSVRIPELSPHQLELMATVDPMFSKPPLDR